MLASPEVRFSMESETHDPIDVEVKKHIDTNSLVEEFMLLANVTVAAHIHTQFPECSLLRVSVVLIVLTGNPPCTQHCGLW